MIVYPGSTVTVKAEPSESKTLVIVGGLSSAMVGSESMALQAGESLYLAPENQAVIENDKNDPLVMIQITTAAEMVIK